MQPVGFVQRALKEHAVRTSFHADFEGHLAVSKILLENTVDPDLVTRAQETAVDIARKVDFGGVRRACQLCLKRWLIQIYRF